MPERDDFVCAKKGRILIVEVRPLLHHVRRIGADTTFAMLRPEMTQANLGDRAPCITSSWFQLQHWHSQRHSNAKAGAGDVGFG